MSQLGAKISVEIVKVLQTKGDMTIPEICKEVGRSYNNVHRAIKSSRSRGEKLFRVAAWTRVSRYVSALWSATPGDDAEVPDFGPPRSSRRKLAGAFTKRPVEKKVRQAPTWFSAIAP